MNNSVIDDTDNVTHQSPAAPPAPAPRPSTNSFLGHLLPCIPSFVSAVRWMFLGYVCPPKDRWNFMASFRVLILQRTRALLSSICHEYHSSTIRFRITYSLHVVEMYSSRRCPQKFYEIIVCRLGLKRLFIH